MRISNFAVKNYQFTLVIFLMTIALGVTTFFNMPRSEDPATNAPQFPVVIIYPGTSPEDMEELIVDPLENRIYALEDIKRIKTKISDGVAVLDVDYKYESNVNDKYQELVREINSMRDELPQDILSIEINKVTPSGVNILQIGLISENSSRESLKKYGERLQKELERIPELKEVEIHGLPDEIVRIDLQLDKMSQMGIPLQAVLGSIQSEIGNIPGGSIEAGSKAFNVKTSGNYDDLDEVAKTLVYSANGKSISLKDIANVHMDFEEGKHITRLNGYRNIFITAALKEGSNITQVQEKYLPVIENFKSDLPPNIDLVLAFDQAEFVNRRLGGLGFDFMLAILLVSITLLPLGGRAAAIVMISIPLSLAIGLILLNLLGYSLNQLSIVGLVVALGLLVDDSIVVVENIERWIREGHSRMEATLLGTKQIGLSVVGCTITLIIAFMPLVFLPEGSGDFIRSLPVAVIMSVLASMLVSLTIIPFLSSRLLKEHRKGHQGNLFLRVLQNTISKSYAPLLERSLKRPVQTLVIALVIFVSSMAFFPIIGFSLFPASEKPQFLVNIITPIQTKISETDTIARKVEASLKETPEIDFFSTNVGKGNPRIYYNVIPENERTDFAQIFVQLEPKTSAKEKIRITENLRNQFSNYVGAKIEIKNFEQGPPVTAPVEVRISGDNLDSLRSIAAKVEKLINETPGTIYTNNPVSNLKTDIKVAIQKDKARALGVNIVDIDRSVRMAIAGLKMGSYSDANGNKKEIIVTSPKDERASLVNFDRLFINNSQGAAIPIRQIADLELESSPLFIDHYNKNRTVSVTAFVQEGYLAERVIKDVESKIKGLEFPNGYNFKMAGEAETREESFGGFQNVIIVTVFLFVAVLILLFKTFKSTIIVLSVIPLGMVGALTALWLTGNSLSFVAIIGLIALAGIEVKNSILLVDFTNQLRKEGKSLDIAIREAGEIRFLPIVLTTLTAIGGLMPIAWSTNPLISPLAIVLIGGLISSTVLSRIVTPVVYKLLPPRIG
ncbi:Multidrug efflux pump subunit AcrB [Aquiflexum balticum DSM 16537]|uniref:Multidrug efflux pump subunit AcrB n=1 Tax=Aquiflexum balticum DSM 16537 TaxID=758820 RepID=A0A1W2H5F0_9BACT|nr:efflux RND transporter permease subunit [Aquiflexum balticum]SMD43852.1 Multidrug efflux pump subunit AcrB [Aquiflexum balticum DSM 16537]